MPSQIQSLRDSLREGSMPPQVITVESIAHANSNAGKNVYISLDKQWAVREAESLPAKFPDAEKPLLYGLPVALKDCFDLAGFTTTLASHYYAKKNGVAQSDSAVAARLRSQGAVIVGKTHLHQLAYGITGQNPDYGDCVQPRDATRFTGGSSSGSVAAVQEGSAFAAIGTDTGGSIRVPSALCSLAGYRASIDLAHEKALWRGGFHLSQSFDTLGWVFGDLADGPLLGEALFGLPQESAGAKTKSVKIACVSDAFLQDCSPTVYDVFARWKKRLSKIGAQISMFDMEFWNDTLDFFVPLQSSEAAAIHTALTGGDFSDFDPTIAERLRWGASLRPDELKRCRERHAEFRKKMDSLLGAHDYLILPCAPLEKLVAGADHSQTRPKILRYTAPMSLAGGPVVTLPDPSGAGVQLAAARGADARLLAFAAQFGTQA
jgi:Asp-tRNA(Asn)/Glu-tRNA(Gln) amidotransferase A subunit family amidase